jgi:hypothetical protein
MRIGAVCSLKGLVVGAVVAVVAASASAQTIITQWNFNGAAIPGGGTSPTTAIGAGSASLIGGTTSPGGNSGTGSSDPATVNNLGWQTTTYPAQGANSGTAGGQFLVSTVNFAAITVKFDQRHSNTSSRWVRIQYTLTGAGGPWIDGADFSATAGDTWFNERTLDLSAVSGANNNPNFGFRVVSIFDPSTPGAYSASNPASTYAGGTLRFDMVTVSGTPSVPTPPTGQVALSSALSCTSGTIQALVTVTPGANPPSSGITVTGNFSAVNGGNPVNFVDQGGNVFAATINVSSATPGLKVLPITIADAQGRSSVSNANVTVTTCTPTTTPVVISQVFGGGGNLGPPAGQFDADYVEIYNRSGAPVNLAGWTLQYASAGNVNGFVEPTDRIQLQGVLQPGQFTLVRWGDAAPSGFTALPTPDYAVRPGFGGISSTGGRVALVNNNVLIGTQCNAPTVVDLVGVSSGALCFEGAGPAPATASDTAATRKIGGTQDTDQNFNDFALVSPNPRNRAFGGFLAGFASAPANVCRGSAWDLSVQVSPGTIGGPSSTGVAVRADLSSLGGSATQALTNSGGNNWTLSFPVPGAVAQGAYAVTITTTDAQGRTDTTVLNVSVADCAASAAPVVISEVFGGGGNADAPFDSDYVQLFNRSASPVNLAGWSLQYASAAGAGGFTQKVDLPSVAINPGKYYLIKLSTPVNPFGQPISADLTATPAITISNSAGRVALVNTTTLLGTDCASASIVDLVGYGFTAVCFEGVATTAETDNFTAVFRKGAGCQDTNQNWNDFTIDLLVNAPLNSAAPANACAPQTGACCLGVGCTVTTQAACAGAVGTTTRNFRGVGTVCNAPGTPPFTNNTTPCCRADFNQNGTRNPTDIFNFLTNYFSAVAADKVTTDTNGNGTQEPTDIFNFLTVYFAGGC